MKKKSLFIFLLAFSAQVLAQKKDTVSCGFFNIAPVSSNTYALFQTTNLATWNRTIVFYPRESLKKIPKDSSITAFQLFRLDSTLVSPLNPGSMTGSCKAKVWFGMTGLPNFSGIDFWTDAINNIKPTLVMDKDIKSEIGATSGWKTFTLQTPFKYDTSKNLAIFVEYIQDSGSVKNVIWTYDTTTVRPGSGLAVNYYDTLQYKFCHKPAAMTPDPIEKFNLATSNRRRPNIRFIFNNKFASGTSEAFSKVKNIEIYPNPTASNDLNFEFEAISDLNLQWTVFDVLGQIQTQKKAQILRGLNSQTIDIQQLKAGYYFLSVDDGQHVLTKSFVKTTQ